MLELIKPIKWVELIGLTGLMDSNQINKNLIHEHLFRHYFSSISIMGTRTKLSAFLVVY